MSDAARSDGEPSDPDFRHEAAASAREEPESRRGGQLIPYSAPVIENDTIFAAADPVFAAEAPSPAPAASLRGPRDWRRLRGAASLAAVLAIGAAAAAEHVHALRVVGLDQAQTHVLAHRLDDMAARMDSLDANRSHDELSGVKKVLADIKSNMASARDVGQLGARVDRLEKDQSARLDKLGGRIDHDAAARLSDMASRLNKLEAKASAPGVAVASAAVAAGPKTVVVAAKAAPAVSLETTGSIDRPPQRLRRFALAGIHDGYAMIEGPGGQFVVAPGDYVPGGGRVLRIERRGRDWAVITTQGEIVTFDE